MGSGWKEEKFELQLMPCCRADLSREIPRCTARGQRIGSSTGGDCTPVMNLVVLKPFMAAVSSDDECGLQAMGLESKIRCILPVMILKRGILVRLYPWRGWAGWNKRIAMGFKMNGAEFDPDPNIVL